MNTELVLEFCYQVRRVKSCDLFFDEVQSCRPVNFRFVVFTWTVKTVEQAQAGLLVARGEQSIEALQARASLLERVIRSLLTPHP